LLIDGNQPKGFWRVRQSTGSRRHWKVMQFILKIQRQAVMHRLQAERLSDWRAVLLDDMV
jgi:hypothetical protein